MAFWNKDQVIETTPAKLKTNVKGKPVRFNGSKSDLRALKRAKRLEQYIASLEPVDAEPYQDELDVLNAVIKRKGL